MYNNIHKITAITASTYIAHNCMGHGTGVNGTAVGAWHLRG